MLKSLAIACLVLCAAMSSVLPASATRAVIRVWNASPNCAWITFYNVDNPFYGFEIINSPRPLFLHPNGNVTGHTYRGSPAKVRAEVMKGPGCTGNVIQDLSFTTDLKQDTLRIIKRPDGKFQILR